MQDAEKNYESLMEALKASEELEYIGKEKVNDLDKEVNTLIDDLYNHMNDDFNTPRVIATLFELASKINGFVNRQLKINNISQATLARLQKEFKAFITDVLGLKMEEANNDEVLDNVVQVLIEMRNTARANKDWAESDKIRNELAEAGIQLKDGKEGTAWKKG